MTVEPCPECGYEDVRVLTEHISGVMTVYCPECGLRHTLKIKLPCIPEEIIEEWNTYSRVQRKIKGEWESE